MSASGSHAGDQKVVVLTGPTAAGKSGLALEAAHRFRGEIVNADSMQVYRFMDIGTAKPTLEQRAAAPHHLFDIVTPDQPYNAGLYARDARKVAADIHGRGAVVLLVGGTGLYIRSFLDGLVASGPVDAALRERLEREQTEAAEEGDPERLHRRLRSLDPDAAERIHPNDLRRTVRALEIIEMLGRPASRVQAAHAFADRPYEVLHLALDPGREVLDARIDERCAAMIEAGLLREVRRLRERGYGADLAPMQAIGYRHINPVADGSDTLANALVAMQRDTRRFARRQRTWLRGVAEVRWRDPRKPDEILAEIEHFLSTAPPPDKA